jgi:uncharacterized membrane protein SpoIIM required for sporulation
VDLDRFLGERRPDWDRLEDLTRRSRRGVGRMDAADLEELVRLYRRTATDLSFARTRYAEPSVEAKLTQLVAAAGAVVMGAQPRSGHALRRFFSSTFPAAVWHVRWFVVASAALTLVPALLLGTWLAHSDRALEASGPAAVRQAYVDEKFESYYSSEPAAAFATQVTTNNIRVAFLAYAAGIALCAPTALLLAFNGGNVGVAGGMFAAAGQLPRFWGLILPHGLLELTAVIIAGAAGLRLGWTIIDPGDRPRGVALADEGRRSVVIVLGLILAFVVAGLIEGFVTGSGLPTVTRVGVGVAAESAFVTYLVVLGRQAAAAGLTGDLDE